MSAEDVAAKIEWEGGIFGALDYGLKATDIADIELAALWLQLQERFNELKPFVRQIDALLDASL